MRKLAGYSAPYESRAQSRERWRRVYMKVRVSKWLLLCIACALLLRAFASWGWWEQGPIWWYPVAVAVFAWLGLGGTLLLSRIRGW